MMFTLGKMSWASMKAKLGSLKKDQSGQGMVEYVLIIALIAVVVIMAFSNVAGAINTTLNGIVAKLSGG